MPTKEQILMVEDGLDNGQLIQLMDAAKELSERVGKLYYKDALGKATVYQAASYQLVGEYSDSLWYIARDLLQFRVRSLLYPLSADEKTATLKTWASGKAGSLKQKLEERYMRSLTTEQITEEIASYRADIVGNLLAIRRGLKAFDEDETSYLWPIVCMKAGDSSVGVGSDVASDTSAAVGASPEPHRSRNLGSAEFAGSDAPTQQSEASDYVQWIAGFILIVGLKPRPTWEDIAKRIVITNALDAARLPRSFRNRLEATNFAGSLFEFIDREDKERTKKIRMGISIEELIDFKERFIHSFSDALDVVGLKRNRKPRSNN